jgi:hypothetical protein
MSNLVPHDQCPLSTTAMTGAVLKIQVSWTYQGDICATRDEVNCKGCCSGHHYMVISDANGESIDTCPFIEPRCKNSVDEEIQSSVLTIWLCLPVPATLQMCLILLIPPLAPVLQS